MPRGTQSDIDLQIANDAGHKAELREYIEKGRAVNWKEFARLTGTSERSVRKAWAEDLLPTVPGGCIPMREGILALCALPRCLRRNSAPEWIAEFRDLASKLANPKKKKAAKPEKPRAEAAVHAEPETQNIEPDMMDAESVKDEMKRAKLESLRAQTEKTRVMSEAKAFELSVKRGEYLRVQDVEIDAAQCAVNVISALRALPSRCAGECVGLTAREIQSVLMKELSLVVDQLRASLFTPNEGLDMEGDDA